MRLFNILTITATVAATAALIPQNASADRVCRQECSGPICQERCVETEGRGGQTKVVKKGENRDMKSAKGGAAGVLESNYEYLAAA
jgi:hypothetical protein